MSQVRKKSVKKEKKDGQEHQEKSGKIASKSVQIPILTNIFKTLLIWL